MEKYTDIYAAALENLNEVKRIIMLSVANNLKYIATKPIIIGNMAYWVVKENGEDVPAYCYLSDYQSGKPFLPIYDKDNTCEFGWSDFTECCRIFNMIRYKLSKI
jgi:hypothetical protein